MLVYTRQEHQIKRNDRVEIILSDLDNDNQLESGVLISPLIKHLSKPRGITVVVSNVY